MNKKINLAIALITAGFAMTTFAAEPVTPTPTPTAPTTTTTTTSTTPVVTATPTTTALSHETLVQCEAYLRSPTTTVTPKQKAALDQCVKNDVCGTGGELTKTVPDCALNLNRWFWSSPTPNNTPLSNTTPNTQTETPAVKTMTTVAPAATPTPTPEVAKPESEQNNQQKDEKSSINWF